MKDLEVKKNVLKEIMDLMDAREGDSLKKHPKLVAAKIEVEKPEDDEMEMPETEEDSDMMPEMDSAEEKSEDDISPEDLERLMELHRSLKA